MKKLSKMAHDLLLTIPELVARVGDRIEYSEDPEERDFPKVAVTLGDRRTAAYGVRSFYVYPLAIRYLDTIDAVETCHDMGQAIADVFTNYSGTLDTGEHVKWINLISQAVNKYSESSMQAEIMLEVHAIL